MKKIFYILGMAAALSAVSCAMEEQFDVQVAEKGNGYKITLTGEAYPDTKVSIGEKDGDKYPLLWSEGDVIAIWSKNTITVPGEPVVGDDGTETPGEDVITRNILGETAELYSGDAGKASGVFQTTNEFALEADEAVVITYPGNGLKYTNDGIIEGKVSAYQEQRGANSSAHVGNYAFAYDEITLKANQKEDVGFTLEQKTAFVKLVLSTTAYSNMQLVGARLSAPGNALAGDISCDIATGEITASNTFDYVGAKFRTPIAFSEAQSVYFTALPCDLTGKDAYIIVTMKDDEKTVTIPAKISGGKLEASCLTVITLSNISEETNEYEWYEPVETRDLVDAWAFGPQNTYYMEAKASGQGDSHLKIDVKARGDISRISGAPKYYGIIAHAGQGGRKLIHLHNNVTKYEATPTNTVNADWTIDVFIYDQSQTGTWGVVGIYDENYNILWSYMICSYRTGDEVKDIAYPGTDFSLMDRALGAPESHAVSLGKKKFDNNVAYFQWGRKDPFGWSNSSLAPYNMQFPLEGSDITTAIQTPYMAYGYKEGTAGDWQFKEHKTDLWGGVNNTTDWYDPNGVGHKTIYDPCPEGYRVPDARVLAEVQKKAEIWETRIGKDLKAATDETKEKCEYQQDKWIKKDAPFYGNNSAIAYQLSGTEYDFWPYHGVRYGDTGAWSNRTITNTVTGCCYWSNSVEPTTGQAAVCMEYCYFSKSEEHGTRHTANRAQSFAVRCMKEAK